MMELKNWKMAKEGRLTILTIDRPPANALNGETMRELREALRGLAQDPNVGVIILTGAGEKAFVAGADIKEMATLDPLRARDFALLGQEITHLMETMDKPIIAAINGLALGGGCELAMACDIRIASERAVLGQPEVNLGIPPGFGGTQRMVHLLGKGKASELIFTGDRIDAREAERIGLVNRVVPHEKLMEEVRALAAKIQGKGPVAVGLAKAALQRATEGGLTQGLLYEAEAFSLAFATEDQKIGMRAFIEKNPKPEFKGH